MEKGGIISFEGCDGSGKTTVLNKVQEYLKEKSIDYILSREPGGVKISEQIRNVILDINNKEMCSRTELLLYIASRAQLVHEVIEPAVKKGSLVVLDRYIDSSVAYQGYAREIGMKEVERLNAFAIGDYAPNLTIYLDITPEVSLERLNNNDREEKNRLDIEKIQFHKKVRQGYLKLAEESPERIKVVDAGQSPEKVFQDVKEIINKYLLEQ